MLYMFDSDNPAETSPGLMDVSSASIKRLTRDRATMVDFTVAVVTIAPREVTGEDTVSGSMSFLLH